VLSQVKGEYDKNIVCTKHTATLEQQLKAFAFISIVLLPDLRDPTFVSLEENKIDIKIQK